MENEEIWCIFQLFELRGISKSDMGKLIARFKPYHTNTNQDIGRLIP